MGTHWRVLNREMTCSTLFFRRLNAAAIQGIDKHRSNESILGVIEIVPVRDNESVDQSSSHGGGEKCLSSGYILKIKPKQTKIKSQRFRYGL